MNVPLFGGSNASSRSDGQPSARFLAGAALADIDGAGDATLRELLRPAAAAKREVR